MKYKKLKEGYENEIQTRLLSEKTQNLGNLKNIQNKLNSLVQKLKQDVYKTKSTNRQSSQDEKRIRDALRDSKVNLESFQNLFSFFRDFEDKAMDMVTSKYLQPDLHVIDSEIKKFKHEHFSKLLKSPQVFTTQILTAFEAMLKVYILFIF